MKVIGIMLTWNNVHFLKCALQQALGFCDEVLLIEGCSSTKYPTRSTDGTCEYIETLRGHPKLKICSFDPKSIVGGYNKVQRLARQKLLRSSTFLQPNNWVTAWDDDMFFFDDDLNKLRRIMEKTNHDTLSFRERRFIYNFRFNTMGRGRWFFHRITEGCHYRSLMTFCYKNGKKYRDISYIDDICYFHFNYVKKRERIKARWEMSIEKGTRASIGRFESWMSVRWDKDDNIFKSKTKIEEIQTTYGLNVYAGRLPEAVNNHPWRYIDDVRILK